VRVTRNLALNARRDLLRRVRNLLRIGVRMPTEYRPDYTEFLEREESRAELRRAIERLTLEEREILALRFGADYSYRQIAVELDLPIGTVMSRLSRIKEKVGIALPEEPES
jgi:RNA polymerase sigma-70 factor (ECF subfamily)